MQTRRRSDQRITIIAGGFYAASGESMCQPVIAPWPVAVVLWLLSAAALPAVNADPDKEDNRGATIDPSLARRLLAELPDIQSFRANPTDQFLVDFEQIRSGHPYLGKQSNTPHTGGHIHFVIPDEPIDSVRPERFPAIYAMADGYVSRVDYSFRLREVFNQQLQRSVANTRYGIDLVFATLEGHPVSMHYSIEPFTDPGDNRFYDKFVLVRVGQKVRKGDLIARMYIHPDRRMSGGTHIHFNLIGGKDHRFMAPAIFSRNVTDRFHERWRDFGRDGDERIPACMGYRLSAEENPFGTGAVRTL